MLEIRTATTPEELEAVQRFRYSIYVEELGRYQATADHAGHRLVDAEDEGSCVLYAVDGDEIVGTVRATWGGEGFSERQIEQYGLGPFLAELPHEVLAVGERMMIAPDRRGADVFMALGGPLDEWMQAHGVKVVLGACEPHLLSMYIALPQRPYAPRNINSPEAGYLIPMLSFIPGPGPEALVGLGDGSGLPRCIQLAIEGCGTVSSPELSDPETYWAGLRDTLTGLPVPIFDGMTEDEIRRCTARSNVIRCAESDRVLKKGGAARNVFVVLSGALEVNDGDHPVAVLLPGDIFGETAFVLQRPRTQNVDVLADGTRILSISERSLRKLTEEDPVVAAKLFGNLSRILCQRLVAAR